MIVPMRRVARYMLLVAVSAFNLCVVLFLCAFGVLGIRGGLSDTSESENVRQGVGFLAMALVAVAWAVGCFIVLKPREPNRSRICTGCGYDLRASPDRCPECGAASAAAV